MAAKLEHAPARHGAALVAAACSWQHARHAFVLLHIGWRSPAGTMGWLLLLLSIWTAVTGLAGVWLPAHRASRD